MLTAKVLLQAINQLPSADNREVGDKFKCCIAIRRYNPEVKLPYGKYPEYVHFRVVMLSNGRGDRIKEWEFINETK